MPFFVESSQFEGFFKKIYLQLPKARPGRGPLLGSKTEPVKVTVGNQSAGLTFGTAWAWLLEAEVLPWLGPGVMVSLEILYLV